MAFICGTYNGDLFEEEELFLSKVISEVTIHTSRTQKGKYPPPPDVGLNVLKALVRDY